MTCSVAIERLRLFTRSGNDYDLRQLQRAEPIPVWLAEIVANVETFGGPATRIQQVLCTEHGVWVGIGWHRDKPHFDEIFGLSLGSAASFDSANAPARHGIASRSMPKPGRYTR